MHSKFEWSRDFGFGLADASNRAQLALSYDYTLFVKLVVLKFVVLLNVESLVGFMKVASQPQNTLLIDSWGGYLSYEFEVGSANLLFAFE